MADPAAAQQVQIRVDESKMTSSYANTIRTSTALDEVVLDFGLNLPMQTSPDGPPSMVFYVGSRVVMNWSGAKRLAMSMNQAITAYEERYGEINLEQPVTQQRS
jgi:Protein of unknown function (DUF3467)